MYQWVLQKKKAFVRNLNVKNWRTGAERSRRGVTVESRKNPAKAFLAIDRHLSTTKALVEGPETERIKVYLVQRDVWNDVHL
mmetsp:Transcript_6254/g.12509  ORF Transcript_6254/g.12509 Transcript_6254/m.12509 type:complete len:82 (+) Transcript_6254:2631-2876(+)